VVHKYYVLGFSYHLHSFLYHICGHDVVKKEMLLHDLITLTLLISSFRYNLIRIGTVVMFLFDLGDAFTYTTKVFVDTTWRYTTYCTHACTMMSWGYLRMYGIPFIILRSIWADGSVAREHLQNKYGYNAWPLQRTMFLVLLVLYALNVYWYVLLSKMAILAAKNGRNYCPIDITEKQIRKVHAHHPKG